jgi:hypothetical protein
MVAIFCAAAFAIVAVATSSAIRASVAATKLHAIDLYGKLPLSFEPNQGQTDPQVKFLSRGPGYSLFLTSTEAVLALRKPDHQGDAKPPRSLKIARPAVKAAHQAEASALRVTLVGANGKARSEGIAPVAGRSNYLIGNDPKKWRTDVPNYGKIAYRNVYPGIDLIYYGTDQRQLEYDFIVAPGADPKAIGLRFSGAKGLRINDKGDLVIAVGGGEVIHHAPAIYQESGGKRQPVAGKIAFRGRDLIGFDVASWDRDRPLLIDPVVVYSTFLGGSGPDAGSAIAVDASGDAYVTGYTESLNFPVTAGAFQTTQPGVDNAFVTKLNPSGTALVYSTYLGGNYYDVGNGIAVDASGDAYVTGYTGSTNFPTTAGAFQTAPDSINGNAFVTELNPSGSAPVYSTYLGGDSAAGYGIAVDASGDAYVTGGTGPTDFPVTAGAFQTTQRGLGNAFVTKLNPSGTALVYSTYLGGNHYDVGNGIAVDASGDAYVTGYTGSANFPTTAGAFQTTNNAANGSPNGFVAKLNPAASGTASLVYSTYLGGSATRAGDGDSGQGIAVDASGDAYVTGYTYSTNFPTTAGAFQTTLRGGSNAFVAKLNPAASGTPSLLYSTYLGGSRLDGGEVSRSTRVVMHM